MLRLETKKVMKWAQSEFGYYGHLTGIGEICGIKKNAVSGWKPRKYVPIKHQDKLVIASNGKLSLVEVK